MTMNWMYFAPLLVAMAVYLVGMFVYNRKGKDSQ